jgi:hypothetical protein
MRYRPSLLVAALLAACIPPPPKADDTPGDPAPVAATEVPVQPPRPPPGAPTKASTPRAAVIESLEEFVVAGDYVDRSTPATCAQNIAEVTPITEPRQKLRQLRAEEHDPDLVEALAVADRCLSCLPAAYDACWDLHTISYLLGRPLATGNLYDELKPVTGAKRGKERSSILKAARALPSKIPARCKAHPGEWDGDLRDKVGDLADRASVLDPPDYNLADALDRLSAASECTANMERYLGLADIALERAGEEPDGRKLRVADPSAFEKTANG